MADGRFTFSAPIQESNVTEIENNYSEEYEIEEIEGRIIIKTELTYKEKTYPVILIGVDFPNKINQLMIEKKDKDIKESNLLEDSDSCILESKFAGELLGQDVKIDEELEIEIGTSTIDFTVKAIAHDTDFLYVVDPDSKMSRLAAGPLSTPHGQS